MYKYDLIEDCPNILNAEKLEGCNRIYVISKTCKIFDHDFLPYFFSKEEFKQKRIKDKKCQAMGISVHDNLEEIKRKIKKMPKLGKYIYHACITKEGEIYKTPNTSYPGHMTFYIYKGYKEWELFICLEKE